MSKEVKDVSEVLEGLSQTEGADLSALAAIKDKVAELQEQAKALAAEKDKLKQDLEDTSAVARQYFKSIAAQEEEKVAEDKAPPTVEEIAEGWYK